MGKLLKLGNFHFRKAKGEKWSPLIPENKQKLSHMSESCLKWRANAHKGYKAHNLSHGNGNPLKPSGHESYKTKQKN